MDQNLVHIFKMLMGEQGGMLGQYAEMFNIPGVNEFNNNTYTYNGHRISTPGSGFNRVDPYTGVDNFSQAAGAAQLQAILDRNVNLGNQNLAVQMAGSMGLNEDIARGTLNKLNPYSMFVNSVIGDARGHQTLSAGAQEYMRLSGSSTDLTSAHDSEENARRELRRTQVAGSLDRITKSIIADPSQYGGDAASAGVIIGEIGRTDLTIDGGALQNKAKSMAKVVSAMRSAFGQNGPVAEMVDIINSLTDIDYNTTLSTGLADGTINSGSIAGNNLATTLSAGAGAGLSPKQTMQLVSSSANVLKSVGGEGFRSVATAGLTAAYMEQRNSGDDRYDNLYVNREKERNAYQETIARVGGGTVAKVRRGLLAAATTDEERAGLRKALSGITDARELTTAGNAYLGASFSTTDLLNIGNSGKGKAWAGEASADAVSSYYKYEEEAFVKGVKGQLDGGLGGHSDDQINKLKNMLDKTGASKPKLIEAMKASGAFSGDEILAMEGNFDAAVKSTIGEHAHNNIIASKAADEDGTTAKNLAKGKLKGLMQRVIGSSKGFDAMSNAFSKAGSDKNLKSVLKNMFNIDDIDLDSAKKGFAVMDKQYQALNGVDKFKMNRGVEMADNIIATGFINGKKATEEQIKAAEAIRDIGSADKDYSKNVLALYAQGASGNDTAMARKKELIAKLRGNVSKPLNKGQKDSTDEDLESRAMSIMGMEAMSKTLVGTDGKPLTGDKKRFKAALDYVAAKGLEGVDIDDSNWDAKDAGMSRKEFNSMFRVHAGGKGSEADILKEILKVLEKGLSDKPDTTTRNTSEPG